MKKSIIALSIVFFFSFFMLLGGVYAYGWKQYESTRVQPIAFSHFTHANKLNKACTSCHTMADKSRYATVPPLSVCMECHQSVKTDSVHIQKLTQAAASKGSLAWAKIHNLPDFIYFAHKPHIQKGLDCTECHGQVRWMSEIRQISSLKMGWCISCHVAKGAPRDCWTCHK